MIFVSCKWMASLNAFISGFVFSLCTCTYFFSSNAKAYLNFLLKLTRQNGVYPIGMFSNYGMQIFSHLMMQS